MVKIEKCMIVVVLGLVALLTILFSIGIKSVQEQGGIKNIIVETGKEIKDMAAEIEKH